jgi:hypothetical protein
MYATRNCMHQHNIHGTILCIAWATRSLLLLLLQPCRHLLPPLPWRLGLMRAAKAAISSGSSSSSSSVASPRELVAIAWGLTAAGVAFSKSFSERLLAAVAAQRSELLLLLLLVQLLRLLSCCCCS